MAGPFLQHALRRTAENAPAHCPAQAGVSRGIRYSDRIRSSARLSTRHSIIAQLRAERGDRDRRRLAGEGTGIYLTHITV
jgi:hypothetical protein